MDILRKKLKFMFPDNEPKAMDYLTDCVDWYLIETKQCIKPENGKLMTDKECIIYNLLRQDVITVDINPNIKYDFVFDAKLLDQYLKDVNEFFKSQYKRNMTDKEIQIHKESAKRRAIDQQRGVKFVGDEQDDAEPDFQPEFEQTIQAPKGSPERVLSGEIATALSLPSDKKNIKWLEDMVQRQRWKSVNPDVKRLIPPLNTIHQLTQYLQYNKNMSLFAENLWVKLDQNVRGLKGKEKTSLIIIIVYFVGKLNGRTFSVLDVYDAYSVVEKENVNLSLSEIIKHKRVLRNILGKDLKEKLDKVTSNLDVFGRDKSQYCNLTLSEEEQAKIQKELDNKLNSGKFKSLGPVQVAYAINKVVPRISLDEILASCKVSKSGYDALLRRMSPAKKTAKKTVRKPVRMTFKDVKGEDKTKRKLPKRQLLI